MAYLLGECCSKARRRRRKFNDCRRLFSIHPLPTMVCPGRRRGQVQHVMDPSVGPYTLCRSAGLPHSRASRSSTCNVNVSTFEFFYGER